MTAIENIQETIRVLDFLTDSVREIMTRCVAMLKEAESELGG
jgi:hypothetical protein